MVISNAETFVEPPNRQHTEARETKETRVLGTVKGAKVEGEISEVHFSQWGCISGKTCGTARAVLTQ